MRKNEKTKERGCYELKTKQLSQIKSFPSPQFNSKLTTSSRGGISFSLKIPIPYLYDEFEGD